MKMTARLLLLPFAMLAELVLLVVCVLLIPIKSKWADVLIRAADALPSWNWYVAK